jgi:hypothetical protein
MINGAALGLQPQQSSNDHGRAARSAGDDELGLGDAGDEALFSEFSAFPEQAGALA